MNVDDAPRKLTFKGMVAAHETGGGHEADPFRLDGEGTLNKERFKLSLEGGALPNADLDHAYKFQLKLDAGPSNAAVRGCIAKPFDFGELDAAGVPLAPIAAVLAFIDPGLAKDQDCAALLDQAAH